jgi:Arc/MetJ-type ribon-helix-helix transcriptional regulator
MTKPITIKMADDDYSRMESIRDTMRFPTQSDFIREAVRRMTREERRNRTREQMKALAEDPEQRELSRQMAEAGIEDWAKTVWPEDR